MSEEIEIKNITDRLVLIGVDVSSMSGTITRDDRRADVSPRRTHLEFKWLDREDHVPATAMVDTIDGNPEAAPPQAVSP